MAEKTTISLILSIVSLCANVIHKSDKNTCNIADLTQVLKKYPHFHADIDAYIYIYAHARKNHYLHT